MSLSGQAGQTDGVLHVFAATTCTHSLIPAAAPHLLGWVSVF